MDELGPGNECAQFTGSGVAVDGYHLGRQRAVFGHGGCTLDVFEHALAYVGSLAHVKGHALCIAQYIGARPVGQCGQRRAQVGRQKGIALQQALGRGLHGVQAQLLCRNAQPGQHGIDIAHGAVAGFVVQPMALAQRIEPMPFVLRVQLARQTHGAQGLHVEQFPRTFHLMGQKTVVEAHVVGYQHGALQQVFHLRQQFHKTRAWATMVSLMPVSDSIKGGIGWPGLTRLLQRSATVPFSTRTMAISVMRSCVALPPVVSRSSIT